jgi:NAD(P)-dependent dehydrogenase (short-subunit alcohol dehydrogenase family)
MAGRKGIEMGRLSGHTAIVTGTAQGIGETYAKALAAEGANVSLCDLQMPEKVMAEIKAAGGKAIGQACDVTDPSALASLVKKTAGSRYWSTTRHSLGRLV